MEQGVDGRRRRIRRRPIEPRHVQLAIVNADLVAVRSRADPGTIAGRLAQPHHMHRNPR
jgi:hypothetical protein